MALQNVHNVNYLVAKEVDLSTKESLEVAIIPARAHVIHVSVEIIEEGDAGGKIDIGFKDQKDALANDADTSKRGAEIANVAFLNPKNQAVIATSEGNTKGRAIVRVGYFLPSTYAVEYHL